MKIKLLFGILLFTLATGTVLAKSDKASSLEALWKKVDSIEKKINKHRAPHLYDATGKDLGKITDTFPYPTSETFAQNASYMVYDEELNAYVLYSVMGEVGVPLNFGIEVDCGDKIVLRNDRDAYDFIYRSEGRIFQHDPSAGEDCSSGNSYDIPFKQIVVEMPVLPLRVQ